MGEGRERIFLYGTLRRGGSRDVLVWYGHEGVEFVGEGRVRGVLHDFVDYPGLRLSADAGWVKGEVFDVSPPVLALLDVWEAIDPVAPDGGEYRRVRLEVERDGAAEECWGYEATAEKCATAPIISCGDWIARHAARR